MEFEWDEDKRRDAIAKHGVDFRKAVLVFEGPTLTSIDDRHDYGERRLISIGRAEGEIYVVVHTPRGENTRVITAWKASQRQRAQYQARYP